MLAHCDFFVAKRDTHHPMEVNLLQDAAAAARSLTIWRQWQHRTECILSAFSDVRKIGHARHDDLRAYLDIRENMADSVSDSLLATLAAGASFDALVGAGTFAKCAKTFVDRIRWRVFPGETAPHDEKIFSVFDPHVRWISKGKAGRPVELGVPICMLADCLGFVLHCEIMREGTDADQSVPRVEGARKKHPVFGAAGFGRGFRSLENRKRLEELLDCAALPKKGRLSEEDKARERGPQFAEMRCLHPVADRG